MSPLIMDKLAPTKEEKTINSRSSGYEARTILFNDDFHTFDEVAFQLCKAIRCSQSQAMEIANRVHKQGMAVVYVGPLERCEAVAMVLEQISLRVNIEK